MQFESKLLPPEGTADVLVEFRPKELTVFHEQVVFEINGLCKKSVSIRGEGVPMKVWNPILPHNKCKERAFCCRVVSGSKIIISFQWMTQVVILFQIELANPAQKVVSFGVLKLEQDPAHALEQKDSWSTHVKLLIGVVNCRL